MKKNTYALLALIILMGLTIRSFQANQLQTYHHDEIISHLVAHNTLTDYHQFIAHLNESPELTTATKWQNFFHIAPEKKYLESSREIIQGLKNHDIHPPVYFLWLNLILRHAQDMSLQTGWASNLLFFIGNCLLLFAVARRLLNDDNKALLAVFIWAIAKATILSAIMARHYEILAFFTLLSAYCVLTIPNQRTPKLSHLIVYGAILWIGFLSNYQFLYHTATLSLLILMLHRKTPMLVMSYGIITVLSLGLALYAFPALLEQSQTVSGWSTFDTKAFTKRLNNTFEEPAKFCIAGLIILFYVLAKRRTVFASINPAVWILLVGNLLAVCIIYLSFIAPKHAMGYRYLASVWPFLSIFYAIVLFTFWNNRIYRYLILLLLITPAALLFKEESESFIIPPEVQASHFVISDDSTRGTWPKIFLGLKPKQLTWVTTQNQLHSDYRWMDEALKHGPSVYISNPKQTGFDKQLQKDIKASLEQRFNVLPIRSEDRNLLYFQLIPKDQSKI